MLTPQNRAIYAAALSGILASVPYSQIFETADLQYDVAEAAADYAEALLVELEHRDREQKKEDRKAATDGE